MKKKLLLTASLFLLMGIVFSAGAVFAATQPTVTSKWVKIFFPTGFKFYKVDEHGNKTELVIPKDRPPILYEDKMYFNIRVLTDALGLELIYNGDDQTVHIYEEKTTDAGEEIDHTSTSATSENKIIKIPESFGDLSKFGELKPVEFKDNGIQIEFLSLYSYIGDMRRISFDYYNGLINQAEAIAKYNELEKKAKSSIAKLEAIDHLDAINLAHYAKESIEAVKAVVNSTNMTYDDYLAYQKKQFAFQRYVTYAQLLQNGITPEQIDADDEAESPTQENTPGQDTPKI